MKPVTLRWTFYLLALIVIGPAAGLLTGGVRAPDGGPDATALVCAAPARGVLATLGAVALAGLLAAPAAVLCGLRAALSTAGLVLAWAAWRTAEVEEIIRRTQSGGALTTLAIEGGVLTALTAMMGVGLSLIAKREAHEDQQGHPAPELPMTLGALGQGWPTQRATAIVIAVVIGGIAAWLVAGTGLKGQTLAAAAAAGLLSGAALRVGDSTAPAFGALGVGVPLAVVGPILGMALGGKDIVSTTYTGGLFAVARIAPLDWAAGYLLGGSLGLAWAGSLLADKRLHRTA